MFLFSLFYPEMNLDYYKDTSKWLKSLFSIIRAGSNPSDRYNVSKLWYPEIAIFFRNGLILICFFTLFCPEMNLCYYKDTSKQFKSLFIIIHAISNTSDRYNLPKFWYPEIAIFFRNHLILVFLFTLFYPEMDLCYYKDTSKWFKSLFRIMRAVLTPQRSTIFLSSDIPKIVIFLKNGLIFVFFLTFIYPEMKLDYYKNISKHFESLVSFKIWVSIHHWNLYTYIVSLWSL